MNEIKNAGLVLLPCPFCGGKATCEHDGLQKVNSSNLPLYLSSAEYSTRWNVKCTNCGTKRGSNLCFSYYRFSNNGTLDVLDGGDGRLTAIHMWNTRTNKLK